MMKEQRVHLGSTAERCSLSTHRVIVDHNSECKAPLARAADTITVEQERLLFTRWLDVFHCDDCGQKVGLWIW